MKGRVGEEGEGEGRGGGWRREEEGGGEGKGNDLLSITAAYKTSILFSSRMHTTHEPTHTDIGGQRPSTVRSNKIAQRKQKQMPQGQANTDATDSASAGSTRNSGLHTQYIRSTVTVGRRNVEAWII